MALNELKLYLSCIPDAIRLFKGPTVGPSKDHYIVLICMLKFLVPFSLHPAFKNNVSWYYIIWANEFSLRCMIISQNLLLIVKSGYWAGPKTDFY